MAKGNILLVFFCLRKNRLKQFCNDTRSKNRKKPSRIKGFSVYVLKEGMMFYRRNERLKDVSAKAAMQLRTSSQSQSKNEAIFHLD